MSAASPSDPSLKRERSPSWEASNEDLTAVHPSPPSKKLKSSSPVPPPLRCPSSRYHLSDGNLVLQVEQTDFKVHRSVLRRMSNVFADMFKVGGDEDGIAGVGAEGPGGGGKEEQGKEKSTKKKKCSMVKLPQDSVPAWETLLSALYDGVSFALQDNTLDDLYGLLSLTDKYEFVSLLFDAKELLVKEVDDRLGPSFDRTDLEDLDLLDDLDPRTLVDILDLGTRFDVPAALPKAFYLLAKSSPDLADLVNDPVEKQSETGWKARGLAKDHLVKLFTVLQEGLQAQKDLFDEFKPWEPRFHHPTCSGHNCRTAVKRRWTTHWSLKLQRNHLEFRALVLLMIKDQSWDGHKDCERHIVRDLEERLDQYDESLSA